MSNIIRGLLNLHSRLKQICAMAASRSTGRHAEVGSSDKAGSGNSELLAENQNRPLDWYQAIHGTGR